MRTLILTLTTVSLITLAGCSNTTLVKARPGCQRGVGIFVWDVCEEYGNVATPRVAIRGEEKPKTKIVTVKPDKETAEPALKAPLKTESISEPEAQNTQNESEGGAPDW